MTLKIEGQKFGRLTALYRVGSKVSASGSKKALWSFECECGNRIEALAQSVSSGHTSSCGCYRIERAKGAVYKNLSGKVFSRLTVKEEVGINSDGAITWRCECLCGDTCVVAGKNLLSGNTKSCGCRKREASAENIARRVVDYVGNRYGKLVVIDMSGTTDSGVKKPLCLCDCGGSKSVPVNSLTSGKTISCGCVKRTVGHTPISSVGVRNKGAALSQKRRARKKCATGSFTAKDIDDMYSRQNGKCVYCEADLVNGFHRDHIMPLALGGCNSIENIQLLCQKCNGRKGSKDPVSFAKEIGFLG